MNSKKRISIGLLAGMALLLNACGQSNVNGHTYVATGAGSAGAYTAGVYPSAYTGYNGAYNANGAYTGYNGYNAYNGYNGAYPGAYTAGVYPYNGAYTGVNPTYPTVAGPYNTTGIISPYASGSLAAGTTTGGAGDSIAFSNNGTVTYRQASTGQVYTGTYSYLDSSNQTLMLSLSGIATTMRFSVSSDGNTMTNQTTGQVLMKQN